MSDKDRVETLESRYREYADAYGIASERGNSKAANRNYDKLAALIPELRAYGDQGQAILRRLMKDRSDAVAAWAALHSLPFAETDALQILDLIAEKKGVTALDAMMTARLWRAGELKVR